MFKFKNLFVLLFSLGFSTQVLAESTCGFIIPKEGAVSAINNTPEVRANSVSISLISNRSCSESKSSEITNDNIGYVVKFIHSPMGQGKSLLTFPDLPNVKAFSVLGLSLNSRKIFDKGAVPVAVSDLIESKVKELKEIILSEATTGQRTPSSVIDSSAGKASAVAASNIDQTGAVVSKTESSEEPQDFRAKTSTQTDTNSAYTSESTKQMALYEEKYKKIVGEEAEFYGDDGKAKYNYASIVEDEDGFFEGLYEKEDVSKITAKSLEVSNAKNLIDYDATVNIKGQENQVPLIIDGKINPQVTKDSILYTKDSGAENLLRDQTKYLEDYNKLFEEETNLKDKFTQKALLKKTEQLNSEKAESIAKYNDAKSELEDENQDLAACKASKYEAFCLNGAEELNKICDGTSQKYTSNKSLKKPSYCSECEIDLDVIPDPSGYEGRCEEFGRVARNDDPEIKEQQRLIAQQLIDRDNALDSDQDYSAAKMQVSSEYLDLVKGFNISSCGNDLFIAADNVIRTPGASGISQQGGSLFSENERPLAIDDPMRCTAGGEVDHFRYSNRLEFYTNLNDNYLSKISTHGKTSLCIGIAYAPNEYAENVLQTENASCNDILMQAKSFCSRGTANTKIYSTSKLEELIENHGGQESIFNLAQQNKDKFKGYNKPSTCRAAYVHKFKACMGGNGKYVNNFDHIEAINDISNTDREVVSLPRVSESTITNIVKDEVHRQYGVCHSFRELGRDSFERFGEWEGTESMQSIDGQYTCSRVTPWTQDFKACMTLIHTYNGFLAGKQGLDIVSSAATIKESTQISQDAAEQMAEGDQLNAGLDAQKKTYELQRDKERANLAFHGSKAAALTALILNFPTPNSVSRKCSEGSEDSSINPAFFCEAATYWGNNGEKGEKVRDEQVFPNQDVKNRMWMEVMKSGADAALAALKQSQLNKMASDVQLVKEAFNGLEDNSTTSDSQIELSYCKYNPSAPSCQNSGERVTYGGGFSYGNVSSQGAGGESYSIGQTDNAFGEYDENLDSEAKRQAIEDLGGIIDNTVADSFDGSFDAPGAGKLGKGSLGGGGGGSGGAGGGGGGGGAPGKAKAGKQNSFAPSKSGLSGFSSGTSSSFASGGSKSKSNSKNPFSSMFGSKKGRTVASKVSNDIAPANSMLFDKISKRYGKVNAENRLINLQNVAK